MIQRKNRFKLTIIFYRNNEYFNIIVIKFKKTSIYVQRKIDQLLWIYDLLKFIRVYVDNVIIFNKTLKKYLKHLIIVFALFFRLRIILKLFKAYIDYFSITLLKQYIIALKLITISKKLKTIFKLRFSHILKKLKHSLNLIDWLSNYVKRYIQKIELLKQRKTTLLHQFFNNKNNQRKTFNQRTFIKQTFSTKIVVYKILQLIFSNSIFFDIFWSKSNIVH